MEVDSFKFLSRLIARYYKMNLVKSAGPIPWTPLKRPVSQSRFALVTSGGLYHQRDDPPFDMERERQEPTWGDPGYRVIPADIDPADLGASHLHIRVESVVADMNILLPIGRFQELAQGGEIGSLADQHYSFMGYQGYPADLSGWKDNSGPQVAQKMIAEQIEAVLLTSA